jgi:hypothetical protein
MGRRGGRAGRSWNSSPATTLVAVVCSSALTYAFLLWLGRSFGSTARERASPMPGDDIVAEPQVTTDHAITIDAPANCVWPWLVQMGWHRAENLSTTTDPLDARSD